MNGKWSGKRVILERGTVVEIGERRQGEAVQEPFLDAGQSEETPAESVVEQLGRKRRRDAGRLQITERDEAVLPWVSDMYAVRLDQLQMLLDRHSGTERKASESASLDGARHVLERWEKLGFAESQKVFAKQPRWLWLTRKGLARLDRGFRYRKPADVMLKHYYEVNRVRLYLESREDLELFWRPERELRPHEAKEWGKHFVDGEAILADAEEGEIVVGIEIELAQKRPAELRRILGWLVAHYDPVWYYTGPKSHAGVARAIADLPEADREKVKIRSLADLP